MTRREWLALIAATPLLKADAAPAPVAPVSIAKCASYDEDVTAKLSTMFDQLGGLAKLVRNKTVTIKMNLTGGPSNRVNGLEPGITHMVHPKVVVATAYLMSRAGAKRVRLVESAWGPRRLEDSMQASGFDIKALQSAVNGLEFENTNVLGQAKQYSRFKVPKPYMYAEYVLNHSYADTDFFVSMAKLKNHAECGLTLSMKNCFGMTPVSIYGDDAGIDEPNENASQGRGAVCHVGKRQPAKIAPPELHPGVSNSAGYRVSRITADLSVVRPIDLAILDGVQSIAGGEGPWVRGVRKVSPGVMIAGTNPVCTDAVSAAVMGYDPRSDRGSPAFPHADNTMLLAEANGVGSTDLKRIDVRGVPIDRAIYRFQA
ncbi:MAG TPA: DUF362 domain-containing protein [Bryobacteraceae bacterium]|jgi:uncharacterized protein (DUF362 family)|nr:DUF362 domain-containing protein [Bryobacteraceae bacterium]